MRCGLASVLLLHRLLMYPATLAPLEVEVTQQENAVRELWLLHIQLLPARAVISRERRCSNHSSGLRHRHHHLCKLLHHRRHRTLHYQHPNHPKDYL